MAGRGHGTRTPAPRDRRAGDRQEPAGGRTLPRGRGSGLGDRADTSLRGRRAPPVGSRDRLATQRSLALEPWAPGSGVAGRPGPPPPPPPDAPTTPPRP